MVLPCFKENYFQPYLTYGASEFFTHVNGDFYERTLLFQNYFLLGICYYFKGCSRNSDEFYWVYSLNTRTIFT